MWGANGSNSPKRTAGDGGAAQLRNRQILILSVLVAAGMIALSFWMAGSGGRTEAPTARIVAEIAGSDTAEDSWTLRSEARLGRLELDLRELDRINRELAEQNRQLRQEMDQNVQEAQNVIEQLSAVIDESAGATPSQNGGSPFSDPFLGQNGFSPPATTGTLNIPTPSPAAGEPITPPSLIQRFELTETVFQQPEEEDAKPLSLWLPAGSHAEAVVIAGVDASAGVVSQGDPRPVLLRITGPAWTAAEDGIAQSVDLAGCTVTGAAFGELSSEKIYVRLQTLTCAGPEPDTVIETTVAGFVAGMGKTGVRGPVVSREGALVERAFLAGLVSGAGQGVATAFAPQAIATGTSTAAVANTGLDDIGRAGLGAGAGTAGRRVSDYLIRRAEQYQPVIQLQAGTPVTAVFLEGTRLDGRPDLNLARSATNEN